MADEFFPNTFHLRSAGWTAVSYTHLDVYKRQVFLFIEAIRGKRVPPDKEGMVHFAGLMLLFALMIFVMFNDIKRLF